MAASELDADQVHDEIAQLRGAVDRLNEVLGTSTGATIQVTDPMVATDPVNGGPEPWHTLGTLSHYTVTRGRFRIDPQGSVELDIGVNGDGANVSSTTFSVTVPAAYRPAVTRRVVLSTSGRNVTAGDVSPTLTLNTTGTVVVDVQANITSALHANPHFPLD